jgi:hypothetical protein
MQGIPLGAIIVVRTDVVVGMLWLDSDIVGVVVLLECGGQINSVIIDIIFIRDSPDTGPCKNLSFYLP